MKRYFLTITILAISIFLIIKIFPSFRDRISTKTKNGISYMAKVDMQNFYEDGIKPKVMDGIYVGGILLKDGVLTENLNFKKYDWNKWDIPTYHERLKPSYYILQKAFENIGGNN